MATAAAPSSEGPVLRLLRDRLRLLRKRRTRITQMEERVAQGQTLNSDQEEILKSKLVVTALIEELEKLRSAARPEDLCAIKSAPEKPSPDGVAAPEPVQDSVTEPVPETQLQVDAATTDSPQKDEVDVNSGENITTATQEEQKPETGGQQQNLKQKDGRRGGRGGRGGRGEYPNGRGYYYNNQYNPRYVEYQNRGQYYDNGYNQGDFDYENHRGWNYNSGYHPRREYGYGVAPPGYYRNAGGGRYLRNSYNTRGREAGRGGGNANQGPNISTSEQV